MQHSIQIILLTAALGVVAVAPRAAAEDPAVQTWTVDDGRGTDYIFQRTDNICGNKDPLGITHPAKVDYEALLATTDEMRRIKKRKIDRNSAEGRTLMTAARRKVLDACEKVRRTEGHCGVWKQISRRDKRAVADITAKVKAKMSGK